MEHKEQVVQWRSQRLPVCVAPLEVTCGSLAVRTGQVLKMVREEAVSPSRLVKVAVQIVASVVHWT
jgi:hypothetical protein